MSRKDRMLKYYYEHKEYIDDRIATGIEQNRKGFAELFLKNQDGEVMTNVKINVEQIEHEFKHGANIFMLDELETEEKNELYKVRFKEAFNLATLPFYWRDQEPEQGKPRYHKDSPKCYRRPTPDLCLEFCEENGIEPKVHCLNYIPWAPDWVPNHVDEEKRLLDKRFRELAELYKDRIFSWEVTNELFVTDERDREIIKEPDVLEWSFQLARKYFTTNQLIINEAQETTWRDFIYNRSAYYMQIERALQKNAPIDCIGMQYHLFFRKENEEQGIKALGNPKKLYAVLDQYAKLQKPIQITEVTIPAYSQDEEDEEAQAEYLKMLYSIWFSHEAVEGIIYWNLVDGYAAWAPQGDMTAGENYYAGGLLRFDMSEKPAYKVVKDLFHKEWHTSATCMTDDCGRTCFKGFYGKYKLSIECNGKLIEKEINFSKKASKKFEIIV